MDTAKLKFNYPKIEKGLWKILYEDKEIGQLKELLDGKFVAIHPEMGESMAFISFHNAAVEAWKAYQGRKQAEGPKEEKKPPVTQEELEVLLADAKRAAKHDLCMAIAFEASSRGDKAFSVILYQKAEEIRTKK